MPKFRFMDERPPFEGCLKSNHSNIPQFNQNVNIVDRARRYIAQTPGAIAGQSGHRQTFAAAMALVHGFQLSQQDAFEILATEYNSRCQPPWTESELRHKIQSASHTNPKRRHGWLLGTSDTSQLSHPLAPSWEQAKGRQLANRAERSLPIILRDFATDPADLWESSPVRLTHDPEHDWRSFLHLFKPEDVVWIGRKTDSAGPDAEDAEIIRAARHFRTAKEWLALDACPPWPLVGKEIFKPGSFSRSKEAIEAAPFLVIESDDLSKAETCAVFSWCRKFMRLRAVVDTANKSLHGWFNHPGQPVFDELKTIMPYLRCDKNLLNPSQPSRLPGAMRNGQHQTLIFLDL